MIQLESYESEKNEAINESKIFFFSSCSFSALVTLSLSDLCDLLASFILDTFVHGGLVPKCKENFEVHKEGSKNHG